MQYKVACPFCNSFELRVEVRDIFICEDCDSEFELVEADYQVID